MYVHTSIHTYVHLPCLQGTDWVHLCHITDHTHPPESCTAALANLQRGRGEEGGRGKGRGEGEEKGGEGGREGERKREKGRGRERRGEGEGGGRGEGRWKGRGGKGRE